MRYVPLFVYALGACTAAPAFAGDPVHFVIPIADDEPGSNRRLQFAFDNTRNVLLISKPHGGVERYDMTSRSFLDPWNVGTVLRDIDITPDGSRVLLAESTCLQGPGTTRIGRVHSIDYATGAASQITWETTYNFGEGVGAHDVVIMNNGKAFVSPDWPGVSGREYLREIDLGANTVRRRENVPFSNGRMGIEGGFGTNVSRSRVHVWEGNTSSPEATIYTVAADSFSPSQGNNFIYGSFSPDGQRLAATEFDGSNPTRGRIVGANFEPLVELPGLSLTYTFDPLSPLVYYADRLTGEFVTVSSVTGEILSTFQPFERTYFDSTTQMAVSNDGRWAFLQGPHGVLVIQIPAPGAALLVMGLGAFGVRRRRTQ